MLPTPQVRVSAYLPFVRFMEKIGAPVERILAKELVPAIAHDEPETLVPVHLAHGFLEMAARTTGLVDFGFVVGQHARIEDLGAFGRNIRQSLTLHDAFGKIRSSFRLYSSAERVWWVQDGKSVYFHHAYTQETGPGSRYGQQCALLLMRDIVRLAATPSWQPPEILSTNVSQDAAMQRALGGARVRRSKFSGFAFPAKLLSAPLRPFKHGGKSDSSAFDASAPANDFVGSIRQVVSIMMKHGQSRLADIAEAIGMQPRTLQRRLAECHEEYADVLARVRFETALRQLSDPVRPIIDIAGDLGYADPSNFTRAFRHWTGISPARFRDQLPGLH